MFEHFSFRVPRYGEDAVRKNPLNRKVKIICNPEFEEIFNSLFKGVDNLFAGVDCLDNGARDKHVEEPMRDSSADDEDSMVAPNKTTGKPFKWRTDDDGIGHEPEKEPPSIFDYLDNGGQFKDICSPAFEVDRDVREFPDSDYEVETEAKNPFVFIANRLTFLIKTSQPIIWDTSTIATPSKDCIFVAFDKEKNPQIDMRVAAKIAHKVNIDMDIQDEIGEYLDGTEWETIYCMPHIMNLKGEDRLGFVFAVTSKEDD